MGLRFADPCSHLLAMIIKYSCVCSGHLYPWWNLYTCLRSERDDSHFHHYHEYLPYEYHDDWPDRSQAGQGHCLEKSQFQERCGNRIVYFRARGSLNKTWAIENSLSWYKQAALHYFESIASIDSQRLDDSFAQTWGSSVATLHRLASSKRVPHEAHKSRFDPVSRIW